MVNIIIIAYNNGAAWGEGVTVKASTQIWAITANGRTANTTSDRFRCVPTLVASGIAVAFSIRAKYTLKVAPVAIIAWVVAALPPDTSAVAADGRTTRAA
jgi:hypothetical protein